MTKELTAEPDYLGHRKRLKDRFLRGNGQDMADYELLELLLTYSIPRKDTKPLAKALIKEFGGFAEVLNVPDEKLMGFSGLKENSVVLLKIAKEAALRLTWQKLQAADLPVIANWDDMVDYCRAAIAYKEREEFHIIFLNSKNMVIGEEIQQRGTIDCVAIHPGEVVKSAMLKSAKSIIIMHNHPSGDVTPSNADIMVTKKINEGLKAVDIKLIDHLIIGKSNIYSFNDHNLIAR